MRTRLLVVGFGPFPRVPVNPSGLLARRIAALPRLRRLGVVTRPLVLRTAYAAIPDALEPALSERPHAVLMIGVATRAGRVRVETCARNRASRLCPDASRTVPGGAALDPGGPAVRRNPVAAQVLAALNRRRAGAALSRDAGRYLCNASYYRTLAEPCPAIFLHIPMPPRTRRPRRPGSIGRHPLDLSADAVCEAVLALARRARAQGVGAASVSRSTESR